MKCEKVFCALAVSAMFFVGCGDSGSNAVDGAPKINVKDGVFVDERDGNKYHVQTFGSDVWFVDNLRYADSSAMPNLKGNVWCPDDEAANCKKFGALYSWTATMDIESDYLKEVYGLKIHNVQGICPDGWRVPTNDDWYYLLKVVEKMYPGEMAGGILKSAEGWVDTAGVEQVFPDNMAFNGQPAGRRNKEGGFLQSGAFSFFWTSAEIDKATASGWTLRNDNAVLDSGHYYKEHGMSVRCIALYPEKIEWSGDDDASRTRPRAYDSVDVDGTVYKVLNVNGLRWMAENLNIETEKSRCYNDEKKNCEKYGRLYTFEEAKTVCPEGWHLSTGTEWDQLMTAVGGDIFALSAKGVWDEDAGTDEIGFASLPGGTIDNGSFSDLGNGAYYWIYSPASPDQAMCLRYYYYSASTLERTVRNAAAGASVRCVEDKK